MDSIISPPIYPIGNDKANDDGTQAAKRDPSVRAAAGASNVDLGLSPASPSKPTSPLPVHRLYSPSKQEIETHPIRQRLSIGLEHINIGIGSALRPQEPAHLLATATPDELDLRQAEQGSQQEAHINAMADNNSVEKGDEVSYQWGGGKPGGTVTDKATDGAVTMETKNGNEVKKKGDSDNPALYISRDSGHDVVKKSSEVEIDEKGSGNKGGDEKEDAGDAEEGRKEENDDAKAGDKRSADDSEEKAKKGGAKKQKTAAEPKENGEPAKKKGRPAKANGSAGTKEKKETKKKQPKKAATESGEPRRSGRNKA